MEYCQIEPEETHTVFKIAGYYFSYLMCNRFLRHHSELYEHLEYEILNLVVHTKMCTNENYPL